MSEYTSLGFIGLGAMGKPMAEQLATKLPSTTKIIVYDVIEDAIKELVEKYPGKVIAETSPKNVAENSVSSH
jgi:3-hydroxyisobutyrate dehydrogenase